MWVHLFNKIDHINHLSLQVTAQQKHYQVLVHNTKSRNASAISKLSDHQVRLIKLMFMPFVQPLTLISFSLNSLEFHDLMETLVKDTGMMHIINNVETLFEGYQIWPNIDSWYHFVWEHGCKRSGFSKTSGYYVWMWQMEISSFNEECGNSKSKKDKAKDELTFFKENKKFL